MTDIIDDGDDDDGDDDDSCNSKGIVKTAAH